MQEVSRENPVQIAPLFENWEETMLWSFLQGKMGRAWRDGEGRSLAAKIVVGDFCFFAGAPNRALAEHFPVTGSDFSSSGPQRRRLDRAARRGSPAQPPAHALRHPKGAGRF